MFLWFFMNCIIKCFFFLKYACVLFLYFYKVSYKICNEIYKSFYCLSLNNRSFFLILIGSICNNSHFTEHLLKIGAYLHSVFFLLTKLKYTIKLGYMLIWILTLVLVLICKWQFITKYVICIKKFSRIKMFLCQIELQ